VSSEPAAHSARVTAFTIVPRIRMYTARRRRSAVVVVATVAAVASLLPSCADAGRAPPRDSQMGDTSGVIESAEESNVAIPTEQGGRFQGVVADGRGNALLLLRRPDAIVAANVGGRAVQLNFGDSSSSLVGAVMLDSTVGYALGYPSGEILRFRVGEGARDVVPFATFDSGTAAIAAHDSTVVVARVAVERGLSITASVGQRTFNSSGTLADLIASAPRAASLFGKVGVDVLDSLVISTTELSDFAYVFDLRTRERDSIEVSRSLRRGARQLLAELIVAADSSRSPEPLLEPSSVATIALVRGPLLLAVYLDQQLKGPWLGATAFLHIVNLRTREQCGDIPIPGRTFPLRRFAVGGDDLISVQEAEPAKNERSRNFTITRFKLRVDRCAWSPATHDQ